MLCYFIFLTVMIFQFSVVRQNYGYILKTKLGTIEGTELTARYNKTFTAYYGIPYAEQPVGDLRFKPPTKANKWNGTLDATRQHEECPQIPLSMASEDGEYGEYEGAEDCLFLSVYTPKNAKAGDRFPVMFYLHGGMFKYGTTVREGPQYFMSRNLIIVTVSSRLGVLGYLSTGDSVVSGNMGLKDQALALKWTKMNIYDFGGDPDRITIAGHSTGSMAVHLHTLSPLSRDNFHRAIMQSGLAVNPQGFMDQDTAKSLSKQIGKAVDCSFKSSQQLVDCLKTKSAEELVKSAHCFSLWQQQPGIIFRPTIEDRNVENAFLTQHPLLAEYPSTNKTVLLGMTSGEAAGYVDEHMMKPETFKIDLNLMIPIFGTFSLTTKPCHLQFVQQMIKARFFDSVETLVPSQDLALIEVLTGIMHGMGLLDVLQKYDGKKYLYLYDYRAAHSLHQSKKFQGVAHADEVPLMWYEPNIEGYKEEDFIFADEMIKRWVNFVHSGDPNVPHPINTNVLGKWYPVESNRFEFLRINKNGTMESDYFENRFGFWKKLPFFSKYFL